MLNSAPEDVNEPKIARAFLAFCYCWSIMLL